MNNTGKTWTTAELEVVEKAYRDNVPVQEIAEQQGRSYMAIVSRLQRLDLMDRLGNSNLDLRTTIGTIPAKGKFYQK